MLELLKVTFFRWFLVATLALPLNVPSFVLSDAISVQNTMYFGKIVAVTANSVIFDIECSGDIVEFDKQLVSGISPEAQTFYLDANGIKVYETVNACEEPVDVEDASGGDGINSAGINFCESFELEFGRKPARDDDLIVVQVVLDDGSNDGLGTNDFYYFDDFQFREGRPIGIDTFSGERFRIARQPSEQAIHVWRMWSRDDPILHVNSDYCKY